MDTTTSEAANAFVAQVTSGGGAACDAPDDAAAVGLVLNLMNDEEQEVLRLVYFDDLKLDGAAEQLGVSKEAVNMRLVRARRKLAKKVTEWIRLVG